MYCKRWYVILGGGAFLFEGGIYGVLVCTVYCIDFWIGHRSHLQLSVLFNSIWFIKKKYIHIQKKRCHKN